MIPSILAALVSTSLAFAGGEKRSTVVDDLNTETKRLEGKMENTGVPKEMRAAGARVEGEISRVASKARSTLTKKKRAKTPVTN